MASAGAVGNREGSAGRALVQSAGDRQPLADFRPLVGHEARDAPLGLQQGFGPETDGGFHGSGEEGDGVKEYKNGYGYRF